MSYLLSQISQRNLKLIFHGPDWWQLSVLFYLGGQGLRTQTCCINIPALPAAPTQNKPPPITTINVSSTKGGNQHCSCSCQSYFRSSRKEWHQRWHFLFEERDDVMSGGGAGPGPTRYQQEVEKDLSRNIRLQQM